MKNIIKYLSSSIFLIACGSDLSQDELGTNQEELSRESGFGVRSSNGFQCFTNTNDLCYYPPSRDLRVHIRTTGMTVNERNRVSQSVAVIQNELENNPGGFWASPFDMSFITMNANPCPYFPGETNVCISKGSVGIPGSNFIRDYQSGFCANSQILSEIPASIPGNHHYCFDWSGTIDLADITTNWVGDEQEVTTHALAVIMLRATGIGLRDSGESNVWSYYKVSPLGKLGQTETEYCRQIFSYNDGGPGGYFSIANEYDGSFCN